MHEVAALVVTFNRKDLLQKNINALLSQTNKCDVFVIDNGSTDHTFESLQPLIQSGKIKYYNTGSNLGGAGGFNYALKEASRFKYKYYWLMDDDTIPKKDALEKLLDEAERRPGFGFLSSKANWIDGKLCSMNKPKLIGGKPAEDTADTQQCWCATFVSLLVPHYVVQDLGLPIREFFIWADDLEYTIRISNNYPSYWIPSSVVVHETKNNIGSDIVKDEERFDRYRYAYRNEVFIAKEMGLKRWIRQTAKIFLKTQQVLFSRSKNKKVKLKIIWGSTIEGIKFNPSIEKISD